MIAHDPRLFKAIYKDTKEFFGTEYDSLWKGRVKASEYVIKNFPEEVSNFRSNLGISRGFTDQFSLDPVKALYLNSFKMRFFYRLTQTRLMDKFFKLFRHQCNRMHEDGLKYKSFYYENYYSNILVDMVRRIPNHVDTLAGNSQDFAFIENRAVSVRHLYTLLRLHDLEKRLDLSKVNTVIEIGGGFGVNAECMMNLYPNIRKYILVDIPSALYTAPLYLKNSFGDVVKNYCDVLEMDQIDINSNKKEIYVIPPWKIDMLKGQVDLFINLFSFQVFNENDLRNYKGLASRVLSRPNGVIWLGGYEVPSGLKRNEILKAFSDLAVFENTPFTESNKHGENTWFSLGRMA